MKTITLMIASLATVMTVSVARADDTKKQAEFCQALSDFHGDVKAVDNIGPQSTLGELRSAVEKTGNDARKVERAAMKIKTSTATAFTSQTKKLRDDARDLPDNITIDQAKTRLQDDIQKVKDAEKQLTAESGCPAEGMPAEKEKMTPDQEKSK